MPHCCQLCVGMKLLTAPKWVAQWSIWTTRDDEEYDILQLQSVQSSGALTAVRVMCSVSLLCVYTSWQLLCRWKMILIGSATLRINRNWWQVSRILDEVLESWTTAQDDDRWYVNKHLTDVCHTFTRMRTRLNEELWNINAITRRYSASSYMANFYIQTTSEMT